MKHFVWPLLIFGVAPQVRPSPVSTPLTARQVVAQMEERGQARSDALSKYVCLRRYEVNNRRFHKSAELSVRMTYTYPGHKTFEVLGEKGVAIIRQRVLKKMLEAEEEASRDGIRETTQISARNYEFRLTGTEMQQGRPAYVLELRPRKASKFLMRGRIWVDCEDFAIVRVDASPSVSPSAFVHNVRVVQQYVKVGAVWLPLYNHSMSESFWFGHTDTSINSSDYQITQKN